MNNNDFWYHGKITRDEAENLLQDGTRINGAFLVRESYSSQGDYVLSVPHDDQVCHFQIRRHTEDVFFSIDESTKIHGLESLIEYYLENPSILSDGKDQPKRPSCLKH